MNDKYFKLQDIVIATFDFDAPVEIEKGVLLLDRTSREILLELKLNVLGVDLSRLSSVSVSVDCLDDAGNSIPDISPFNSVYRDIYLNKAGRFGEDNPILLDQRVRRVKIGLQRVVFTDSTIWYPAGNQFTPPKQEVITSLQQDLVEQFNRDTHYLSPAVKENYKFIPKQLADYWLCTCGRPNSNVSASCFRCGLSKESVFKVSPEILGKNLEKYKEWVRLEEEEARIASEKEKLEAIEKAQREEEEKARLIEEKKVRSKRLKAGILITGIVGLLVVLFFFVIIPAVKYNQASNYLASKDYNYAIYVFDSLGNYKNSEELISEANYQKANDFLIDRKFDDAIKTFSYIESYRDSSTMKMEANYQKAVDFLSIKNFDVSISIFESLGGYKDSKVMIKESNYLMAQNALKNKEFDLAFDLFSFIGNYKDSPAMKNETNYQKAIDYLDNNQYDDAYSLFFLLGDYKDSSLMAKESKYQKAKELLALDKFDSSRKIFVELGDYSSAVEMVKEIDYQNANKLLSNSQFEEAVIILKRINGFKDSDKLLQESNYQIAVSLFNDKQFSKSYYLFTELGDYKESNSYVEAVNVEFRSQKEKIPQMQLLEIISSIRWYNSFAWTSDEELAVVHWSGEAPFLLDYKNSQTVIQSEAINGGLQLDWSPDGKKFAIISQDGLDIWDVERGVNILQITENENISEFKWSPVGEKLGIVDGKVIDIWDIQQGKNIIKIPLTMDVDYLYWSPDGNFVVVTDGDAVKLWDARSGTSEQSFSGSFLQFSPDGRIIGIGNDDSQSVELWDLATGEQHYVIKNVTSFYSGDFFSPTGNYYALFQSGRLKIWDFYTDRLVNEFEESDTIFTWSPDGKTIAITIPGNLLATPILLDVLEIRNITSGDLLSKTDLLLWWATGSSYFSSANYSPNGLVFADSSDETEITKLYDAETGNVLLTLSGVFYPNCWSPNGTKLLMTHMNPNNGRYTFEIWGTP